MDKKKEEILLLHLLLSCSISRSATNKATSPLHMMSEKCEQFKNVNNLKMCTI